LQKIVADRDGSGHCQFMRTNTAVAFLLIFCLPALCGCSTFITGKKQSGEATQTVLSSLSAEQASEASERYEKLHPYFENFGVVNAGVYRSARPDLDELWRLKDAGITTIVNFRESEEDVSAEVSACEDLGINHFSLPWDGHDKEIDPSLVSRFLEIIENPANLPALVHCKRGAERTGTLIAVYRIEHDGWSAEQAYEEMDKYKFRSIWFGHLKRYVLEYGNDRAP
jgi:protein tyrosine/serine phosphatase